MSQTENIKPKGPKNPNQMLVRYGRLGLLGWFDHHESHISKLNSNVVIKTARGLELGQIVGAHCYRGGHFKSSSEQVEEYFCNRTKEYPLGEGGTFVRYATPDDLNEQEHLEKNSIEEAKCCQRIANELNLEMKIVEAEHLFGGERIIFYFTSDHRVDFRDLVKRLAREYQTRIELRQIGSRDEAKMISDYETCGQQCCCSRFLKILEPVNMRMAKVQKATLDPAKISGHCGRLKCCLRYEDKTYLDLKKKLPSRNTPVRTPKGVGKVIDVQILTQLVNVQMAGSGDRQAWPVDEITVVDAKELEAQTTPPKQPQENNTDKRKRAPASESKNQAITAELEEIAEDEQDPVVTDIKAQSDSDKQDQQQQQAKSDQGEQGQGRNKKRRRRRPRNKKRSGENATGGDQNQQDQQNQKKRPPRNRNRENKNKPSGGDSDNRTETSQ